MRSSFFPVLFLLAALSAGCGGGGGEEETPTPAKGAPKKPAAGGAGAKTTSGPGPAVKKAAVAPIQYKKKAVLGTPRVTHANHIYAIRMHPDGKTFVTGSFDGTVGIWNVADGTRRRTINVGSAVYDVAISPDGKTLATADHNVSLWDFESGASLGFFQYVYNKGDRPECVVFSGDKVVFGGTRLGLGLGTRGQGQQHLAGFNAWQIRCLAATADGKLWAAASGDGPVQLYDAQTLNKVGELQLPANRARSLFFDGSGTRLVTYNWVNQILLWDVTKRQQIAKLGEHEGQNEKGGIVTISAKGDFAASADSDPHKGRIRIWNTKTGAQAAELKGHTVRVSALAFTLDGKQLISGDERGLLRFWSVPEGTPLTHGPGHVGPVRALAWSERGDRLFSAGRDGQVIAWRVASGGLERAWQESEELNALALSTEAVYVGGAGGAVIRHQLGGPSRLLQRFDADGKTAEVNALALAEGKWLVAGMSPRGTLVAMDPASGNILRRWDAAARSHQDVVLSMVVDPAQKFVLSGGGDTIIKRWLPGNWELFPGLPYVRTHIQGLDITRDGRYVAAGAKEAAAYLDLQAAQGLRNFTCFPHETVFAVAFHPNGEIIAAGTMNKDEKTGRVALLAVDQDVAYTSLTDHLGPVRAVRFSPDGKLLATGSADGSIILWEAMGG